MSWNYAEFSAEAKKCGGPEKYVEKLINSGKMDMVPWIGVGVVGVVGGIAIGIGIQKLIDYFSAKMAESKEAVEEAKREIIQGIKAYDAEHSDQKVD